MAWYWPMGCFSLGFIDDTLFTFHVHRSLCYFCAKCLEDVYLTLCSNIYPVLSQCVQVLFPTL